MPAYTLPESIPTTRAGLEDTLLEAGDALRELRAARPDGSDPALVESYRADVRATTEAIQFLDPLHDIATRTERAARGGVSTETDLGGPDVRTAGELFTTSETYEARDGKRGTTGDVEVRTLLTSSTSDPAAGLWRPVGTPIPPVARQARLFVRDLLSVSSTGLSSIPYIKELTPATNETGASSVAEGVAKPEVTMQFESDDAPVRKIAAWIPITTEIADDAPTLRGYIDNRLAYMLALREEREILSGNGVSPDLRGILNTSGIQSQSGNADDIAQLGLAIGKIELVDLEADGIAMHPTAFWTMVTTRNATQFDLGLGGPGPFNGVAALQPWGLPVVRSRALGTTQAIVGAWKMGATLFDREQTTIRTTDSHSDYFILNKLVILAEERIALAVHRPDAFVNVTMS